MTFVLFHDCSRPDSTSLNAYADCEHYSYKTVDKVTANTKEGAFMVKIDLKRAYCHSPLCPSNYQATGLKWKFNSTNSFTYLYGTKLLFGAKQSPEIFHHLTQLIMHTTMSHFTHQIPYPHGGSLNFLGVRESKREISEGEGVYKEFLFPEGLKCNQINTYIFSN